MDGKTASFDAAMAATGSKMTYAGAGTSVTGWALSSEVGVLAGIIIGVVGLAVNTYFRWKEDRRRQVEHEARMRDLRQ